jgi:hypothetical protein
MMMYRPDGETAESGIRSNRNANASISAGSNKSYKSSLLHPRETGSVLRWELQSKDSHLGQLMKNEHRVQERLQKEKRFATIYNEF